MTQISPVQGPVGTLGQRYMVERTPDTSSGDQGHFHSFIHTCILSACSVVRTQW